MKQSDSLYQLITNQLIEMLEHAGSISYQEPYFPMNMAANLLTSDKRYRGFNQLYLCFLSIKMKYSQNLWITFSQAKSIGANVKKGECSVPVCFWNWIYIDLNGNNISNQVKELIKDKLPIPAGITKRGYLKKYNVFNFDQVENIPDGYIKNDSLQLTLDDNDTNELANELVMKTGAEIRYSNVTHCFYSPSDDYIYLCNPELFKGEEPYYATLFHELAHWTGHASRLNRPKGNKFGSPAYAYEELIAEFSAAFLCGNFGFVKYLPQNAAYLKSWIKALKNDMKMAYKAATAAQEAVDFIFNLAEIALNKENQHHKDYNPIDLRKSKSNSFNS